MKKHLCITNSVISFERLDFIKSLNIWGFTIGGAFFENKFGDGFARQIEIVHDYLKKKESLNVICI